MSECVCHQPSKYLRIRIFRSFLVIIIGESRDHRRDPAAWRCREANSRRNAECLRICAISVMSAMARRKTQVGPDLCYMICRSRLKTQVDELSSPELFCDSCAAVLQLSLSSVTLCQVSFGRGSRTNESRRIFCFWYDSKNCIALPQV